LNLLALELPTHPQKGIEVDLVEKAVAEHEVKACILVANFHNPLGLMMAEESKKQLVVMLNKRRIPIIEDDIHGDLYFGDKRPTTLKSYDRTGTVLYCSSFSKTIAPGLRIGWTLPGKFKTQVRQLKLNHTIASPPLVQYAVAERSVIPVVGQELFSIQIDGERKSLDCYLARKLAERLRVPTTDLPADCTINEVACRFLQQPGARREDLYRRMNSILTELAKQQPPTPPVLKKLAEISDFQFFLTTSFDFLLEQAINEVRFDGQPNTDVYAYSLNDCRDIPRELTRFSKPVVFHLLGRYSVQPNYALTEEDTLEFMHALQSETRRPRLLLDELKKHHLLLLGASYSNWLSRFFLRILRNERLTLPKGTDSYIADTVIQQDASLSLFYSSPLSYGTKIFPEGSAEQFVNELHTRWSAINPEPAQKDALQPVLQDSESADESAALGASPPVEMQMAEGAVFLSYASEDIALVRLVKEGLERAGLIVWFDKKYLEAGDNYDMKIQRSIRKCCLFVPFISRNTERRVEGFFRREWFYAVERARNIDPSIPFILPVVIDDTSFYDCLVPEAFDRLHWSHIESDPKDFIESCVKHFRSYQKRSRGY
jgi:hypothetical protein